MDNEIRGVTYIAISVLVLSIVLGFSTIVMNISRDTAEIRNNEIAGNNQLLQYMKYNKFNANTLCGDEVIECIREYYSTGIDIFVNSRTNGETVVNSGTDRLFNSDEYIRNPKKFEVGVEGTKDSLMAYFPTEVKYRAYLVYNSDDIETRYDTIEDNLIMLGGITDDIAELEMRYDNAANINVDPNSMVTGIILIRIK